MENSYFPSLILYKKKIIILIYFLVLKSVRTKFIDLLFKRSNWVHLYSAETNKFNRFFFSFIISLEGGGGRRATKNCFNLFKINTFYFFFAFLIYSRKYIFSQGIKNRYKEQVLFNLCLLLILVYSRGGREITNNKKNV